MVLPEPVDVHVHLREPGFLIRRPFRPARLLRRTAEQSRVRHAQSGSDAGQFADACPQLERIRTDAVIDATPYGAITAHRGGRELADMEQLAPYVAGFSDDGSGVQDADDARRDVQGGKPRQAHRRAL